MDALHSLSVHSAFLPLAFDAQSMSTTDLAALDLVDSVELAGEEMSEQSLYGAVEMSDVTGDSTMCAWRASE